MIKLELSLVKTLILYVSIGALYFLLGSNNVIAQSCSGTGICGTTISSCTCSDGSGTCSVSPCGSGGTCNCSNSCSTLYPVSPDHFTCPYDGSCSTPCTDCLASGTGCYITSGPTPTSGGGGPTNNAKGNHYGNSGTTTNCRAFGDAYDPNSVGNSTVQISIWDPLGSGCGYGWGGRVVTVPANLGTYTCCNSSGTCASCGWDYDMNPAGVVPKNCDLRVHATTQDLQTGDTNDLQGTPKTINCQVANSPPTCSVTGPTTLVYGGSSGSYSFSGSDANGNLDHLAGFWAPTTTATFTFLFQDNFTNRSSYSRSASFTCPSTGSFYVGCGAEDGSGAKCSSNPWCEWSPNPPYAYDCAPGGYVDCTGSDLVVVNCVTPTPTSAPLPTPTTSSQCSAPTLTCGSSCSSGNVIISCSWNSISGASSYRYQIWQGGPTGTNIANATTTGTSFSRTLPAGVYDTIRTRVELATGCGSPSPWSNAYTIDGSGCGVATPTPAGCSCSTIMSADQSTTVGNSVNFSSVVATSCPVLVSNPGVSSVIFTSLNSSVASVCNPALASCPAGNTSYNDTSSPYVVKATGYNTGSATIRGRGILNDGTVCTVDTATITVGAAATNTPTPVPPTSTPTPTPTLVPPVAPSLNATASCPSGSPRISVSWSSVSGASDYHLYRCTGSSCTATNQITTTTGTSYIDTAVSDQTTYGYRVRAHRHLDGQFSLYSNSDYARPVCPNCDINVIPANPDPIKIGGVQSFSANPINVVGGSIQRVDFRSTDSSVALLCAGGTGPCSPGSAIYSDNAFAYTTDATGISSGITNIQADVIINGIVACSDSTPARLEVVAPSCTFNFSPPSATIELLGTQMFSVANLSVQPNPPYTNSDVDRAVFTRLSDAISLCAGPGPCPPVQATHTDNNSLGGYTVAVTGQEISTPASPLLQGDIYVAGYGPAACTQTADIEVVPPDPWWQVKEGDAVSGSDIKSDISFGCTVSPGCEPYFNIFDTGEFPGIAVYNSFSPPDFGAGNVSTVGWLVNSVYAGDIYNYDFFEGKLDPVTRSTWTGLGASISTNALGASGSPAADGYYYFHNAGTVNINAVQNLGSRKVVLFVEGDLNINSGINLTDGTGFFLAIVMGDINVDPSVGGGVGPHIEGLFHTDGTFSSGTTYPPTPDQRLVIRGSVSAAGFSLLRDLEIGNVDTPAEVFEFAPDLILNYPESVGIKNIEWKEVAP